MEASDRAACQAAGVPYVVIPENLSGARRIVPNEAFEETEQVQRCIPMVGTSARASYEANLRNIPANASFVYRTSTDVLQGRENTAPVSSQPASDSVPAASSAGCSLSSTPSSAPLSSSSSCSVPSMSAFSELMEVVRKQGERIATLEAQLAALNVRTLSGEEMTGAYFAQVLNE